MMHISTRQGVSAGGVSHGHRGAAPAPDLRLPLQSHKGDQPLSVSCNLFHLSEVGPAGQCRLPSGGPQVGS